jgi:hypothetical protein
MGTDSKGERRMNTTQMAAIEMKIKQTGKHFQQSMLGLVLMSLCPLGALAQTGHAHAAVQEQTQKSQASALVKIVRDSTERFKDVSQAEKEGYALQFGCVSGPDSGAMGLHYINGALVGAGIIDPTHPPIVIYEAQPNWHLELIGADFLCLRRRMGQEESGSAGAHGTAVSLLGEPQSLRAPGLLHVARVGVEGQSQRRVRELAPQRFLPVVYTSEFLGRNNRFVCSKA